MSLLKVSGLGKHFGGVKAVDGIDFSLESGELLALIGPNGAGKSTTFNMVNGQLRADNGSIALNGQELVGLKPREIWRKGVGRTFQIAQVFLSFSVIENVQIALHSSDQRTLNFWNNAKNYRRDQAMSLLELVGMVSQADRPCHQLAYGDIKRVELAIAMANELMTLTKKLVIDTKMAVLFTEHSMDVVFAHADRIIVLARGRLIAQGSPAQIRAHPQVQEVYFGSGKTFEKKVSSNK